MMKDEVFVKRIVAAGQMRKARRLQIKGVFGRAHLLAEDALPNKLF